MKVHGSHPHLFVASPKQQPYLLLSIQTHSKTVSEVLGALSRFLEVTAEPPVSSGGGGDELTVREVCPTRRALPEWQEWASRTVRTLWRR